MTQNEIEHLLELLQRSMERSAETLDTRMHEWRSQQTNDYQRVLDEVYRSHRDIAQDLAERELRDDKDRTVQRGVLNQRLRHIEWALFAVLALIALIAWEVFL